MDEFAILRHLQYIERKLPEELGYRSAAGLYNRINGKHIYVDTWRELLSKYGYEVVVRPKGGGAEMVVDDEGYTPLQFQDMDLGLDRILVDAERLANE